MKTVYICALIIIVLAGTTIFAQIAKDKAAEKEKKLKITPPAIQKAIRTPKRSISPSITQAQKTDLERSEKEKVALKRVLSSLRVKRIIPDRVTSAPVTNFAVKPRPILGWEIKNDRGVYYTTSRETDLDMEVALGANILKSPIDNRYVRTVHKQYRKSCGPASLAMVLEQLGISNKARYSNLIVNQDVDNIGTSPGFNVGYRGSMEHIMWLGYHRKRMNLDQGDWNDNNDNFLSRQGVINLSPSGMNKSLIATGSNMNYLNFTEIPKWLWNGAPVGCNSFSYVDLVGVMNYIFSGQSDGPWRDARAMFLTGRTDAEVVKIRRLIKGYIDHNISLVAGVDDSDHFNALIGYRGDVSPASSDFWVYTADPLNGWGRDDASKQPGTWRRIKITRENLGAGAGALMCIILWNHHAAGTAAVNASTGTAASKFRRGNWAEEVDRSNRNDWLTGRSRQPSANDPLSDRLAVPASRMP